MQIKAKSAQRLELFEHIGALTRIALEGVELAPMLDRIAHYLHERFRRHWCKSRFVIPAIKAC